MSRWRPDARERLERAALELFESQGFAATTVPQITARAGLTTRTFHRYFADKREVLFAVDEIPRLARQLVAEAPASQDPLATIVLGLASVAEARFEGRRDDLRRRRAIVRSDEGLLERDLHKRAATAEAVREALGERGVDPTRAALLAETGVTLLGVALQEWLDDPGDRPLADILATTLATLRDAVHSGG